jgi:hypothetical protein
MHKSDQKCLAMQEPSTHDIRCTISELGRCGQSRLMQMQRVSPRQGGKDGIRIAAVQHIFSKAVVQYEYD